MSSESGVPEGHRARRLTMPGRIEKILEGVYGRWGEGEFEPGDYFDPLIVFVMGPGFPEAGVYLGTERVAEYMRGFLEPWERVTIRAEEINVVGDSAVVAVRQAGAGRGSGAATEFAYFQVWSFRGDRAIRFETFRERADAFGAVGPAG